jgi:hypothetical protein
MPDYRESSVAGTQYQRGRGLYFENPLGAAPSLLVREERVINLTDRQIVEPAGEILKRVEDMSVWFEVLDPTTNIPTGETMTYQDLYVALYSLYWHLATERDGPAPPEVIVEDPLATEPPLVP